VIDGSRDVAGALHKLELSIARKGFDEEPVRAALVEIDAGLRELHDWAERSIAHLGIADPKSDDDLGADKDVTLWFEVIDRRAAKSRLDGRTDQRRAKARVDTDEVVEAARPQGDRLIRETPSAEAILLGARPDLSEHVNHIEPEPDSVDQVNDDGGDELGVVIDDRDPMQPNSRDKRWPSIRRADRKSSEAARHNKAISERFSRVLSSSNRVEDADPDEVEARIRNLSHGTNSE
jgi:hypothetical protein